MTFVIDKPRSRKVCSFSQGIVRGIKRFGRSSWLERRRIALLDGAIIGPQQPRGHAAPGAPGIGEGSGFLEAGPRRQGEGEPRRLLQGEIAGRPGVGMSEAEQQVDIGRPRADAVDGAQCCMSRLGRQAGKRVAVEPARGDRLGDLLERADLRRGKAEPGEPARPRPDQGLGREGVIGRRQPPPDRIRARGGKLLRHHDASKPGKAAGPAAQRQPARHRRHRFEARVGGEQRGQSGFDVGFGVDAAGHGCQG